MYTLFGFVNLVESWIMASKNNVELCRLYIVSGIVCFVIQVVSDSLNKKDYEETYKNDD